MAPAPSPLSARNPAVQHLRRLFRRRSSRSEHGQYVVEGPTLVLEALASGVEVVEVYLDAGAPGGDALAEVVMRAEERGVPVRHLAPGVLGRIADAVTPQPAMAMVAGRPMSLDELVGRSRGGLVLVLAGIADPGNAGTLVRTAEAIGASGVVFGGTSVDPLSPKTIRSSAGSLFRVPVATPPDPHTAVAVLRDAGFTIVGATQSGDRPFDRYPWPDDVALVLGGEAKGLPTGLFGPADVMVSIPMAGQVESLNVAVAGSLLCFEWARRRSAWGYDAARYPPRTSTPLT